MYKKINRRDMIENSNICRKCSYHNNSYYYISNMSKYMEIMQTYKEPNENTKINIKILFHILSAKHNNKNEKIVNRINDIIISVNDDFNSYSSNPNIMNTLKYKNIVNNIFISNMQKQYIYLGDEYITNLPETPSDLIFELGEIYFYPIKSSLKLSKYNDTNEVEIEIQVIKKYIHDHLAYAINPESFLNIWIIDMDTSIMSFSNFPWEQHDNFHGIYLNIKCIFPEDYKEQNFNLYKSVTHSIGHYLGLIHLTDETNQNYQIKNLHIADNQDTDNMKIESIVDPSNSQTNKKLITDINYNPSFMNFMEITKDKFVAVFTKNQIKKMHFMIKLFRSTINHHSQAPGYRPNLSKETVNKINPLPPNIELREIPKNHHHHRHHKHTHKEKEMDHPIMYPDTRNIIPEKYPQVDMNTCMYPNVDMNTCMYPNVDMNTCMYPNVDMNIRAMPIIKEEPAPQITKENKYFNPIEIYSNNTKTQSSENTESKNISRRFMRIKS